MPSPNASGGPVLQVLASGFQLWIRQQCQSVESLEIQLDGSALGLLRGRLAGVQLLARKAVYRHLPIEQVQLSSEAIALQMGNLLKGQTLQLDQPFAISGQLSFTAVGLKALLTHPQWQWLAHELQDHLLGQLPLLKVSFAQGGLVMQTRGAGPGDAIDLPIQVGASGGTIVLSGPSGQPLYRLPMDPNISIEQAWVEAGMLQLRGRARVSP